MAGTLAFVLDGGVAWWHGCQMVCFQTKYPILGKFLEGLVLEDVGMFYGYLIQFTADW
jgi:hypothetical protein